MADRESFLKAIEDNPLDPAPRHVYADWLDERGEVDEANEQRRWTGEMLVARAWLVEVANNCSGHDEGPITYDDLIQAGHDWIDHGDYLTQHGYTDLQDTNTTEFWRNWQLVTGRELKRPRGWWTQDEPDSDIAPTDDLIRPEDMESPFSCSC